MRFDCEDGDDGDVCALRSDDVSGDVEMDDDAAALLVHWNLQF